MSTRYQSYDQFMAGTGIHDPPFSELSTQRQIDTVADFASLTVAEQLLKDHEKVALQAQLVCLDRLLWRQPISDVVTKLHQFREELAIPKAVRADWEAVNAQDRRFRGTKLDNRTLAEVIMHRDQEGNPLSYVYECNFDEPAYYEPRSAIRLLAAARRYTPRGGERFAELIDPLQSMADRMYEDARVKAHKQQNHRAIAELYGGDGFMPAASEYVDESLDPAAAAREIADTTANLIEAAAKLSQCFAPEHAAQVEDAFLRVGLRFVYGLRDHQRNNGKTDDAIKLSGNFFLPVKLRGDEPSQLLAELMTAVDEIHTAVTSKRSLIIDKLNASNFSLLRYVTLEADEPRSQVQEYIRPRGAFAYDRTYEYGRPTEGVEASHSFIYTKNRFLHYSKDPADTSLVSIRIDFEGQDPRQGRAPGETRRDPTSEIGTMSLDIGSILGKGNVLGVRIGRFLAWCDQLRCNEQKATNPDAPSFNHGYEAFETGSQTAFAAALTMLTEQRHQDARFVQAEADLSRLILAANSAKA